MDKRARYIVDTTLRDGEQAAAVSFSLEQKLHIFSMLEQIGVHQIEAGVPASSPYEKKTISKLRENRKRARISVWARLNPDDIRHCIDCAPDIIHISIPASYMHIYTKLQKNKNWVINQLYACIGILDQCDSQISIGFEDASRADLSFVISITRILSDFSIKRIRLADTVGIMTPTLCRETARTFLSYVDKSTELGYHAHNDLGMALANTIEMLKSGCLWADTTLCGIGERAGNCDFRQLIKATDRLFHWGISSSDTEAAEKEFRSLLLK